MKIYPSIDIYQGRIVRLKKGDFSRYTEYAKSIYQVVTEFEDAGASYLHVIDLDGARFGRARHQSKILEILKTSSLKVQVGGGIRTFDDASLLLDEGADRVVLGSALFTNPELFTQLLNRFGPERLTISIDCQRNSDGDFNVVYNGWQSQSNKTVWEFIDALGQNDGLRFLCTDIVCDGMAQGSNVDLYGKICQARPSVRLQASGGVSDLVEVQTLIDLGVESCVVGRAFYEGSMRLEEIFSVGGDLDA